MVVDLASQDESEDELPKFTGIRIKRPPRTVQPAHGIVREVEQMYDSDEGTAPLRAHRDTCEKCGRAAAHILLSGWTRTSRKGKKKQSRSGPDADLLESSDGEATFAGLGGWVRWLVYFNLYFKSVTNLFSASDALLPTIGTACRPRAAQILYEPFDNGKRLMYRSGRDFHLMIPPR